MGSTTFFEVLDFFLEISRKREEPRGRGGANSINQVNLVWEPDSPCSTSGPFLSLPKVGCTDENISRFYLEMSRRIISTSAANWPEKCLLISLMVHPQAGRYPLLLMTFQQTLVVSLEPMLFDDMNRKRNPIYLLFEGQKICEIDFVVLVLILVAWNVHLETLN